MTFRRARASLIRDLVALMKPRISVLSVITAATGLWLAPGEPTLRVALSALSGIFLLVASAGTLNMYVERDVDGRMERTKHRPLPAGRLPARAALVFGLLEAALALPLLAWGANLLSSALGALSLVVYVLVYTPLKRRSTLSLLVGAIPGAMPPVLGWTAASGSLELGALALFAVIFVWQMPHFLAIAIFRREDYVAAGLRILPAVRGMTETKQVIVRYVVLQVLVTLSLVPLGFGGTPYLVGAAVLGAWMLVVALGGLHALDIEAERRWARRLFLGTLVYLPVLFGLLLV